MSTDYCRWLFLLIFLIAWTKYTNSKEIRVVCYYTNWSVYRPGTAKFSPQNINPYLCTHLIYAFGGFTKENTLKPFDKYQDIEKGGYAKFTGLKTYNKNLKTMLAIGGWNEGSSRFSPMVANAERRKELIKNAIKFLRQNHFDGLDLDWEYPSFRDGGKTRDKDNYAQLVQEMREEFEREAEKTGRPRLLLTMAVPAGIEYINKGYDVPRLTKYLDWMNILSYDYHSAFEPAVNHHAPLYSLEEPSEYNYDTELNIEYTIQHYLEKGADPNKLVLGIPTYGRSYTLFNPEANEIGAPADGPGDMGEATRENGYLAYYEICEYIKSQDWEVVQPNPDAMGPYAFKGNQWVGYDDDAIARKKAAYVAENNLGGIMFWSIDNDDFRGNCHGKPFPIIEAAKESLISAYGLTDENLVSPPAKATKPKTRTRTSSKPSDKKEDSEKKTATVSRRRNRVKSKSETTTTSSRAKLRRKESRSTTEGIHSSLELVTPSYTTPAPPPTPDLGGEFKCEDEGFYPHPKDCKKYYWCLSGPGELGIIAHQFTCPAGLYFNKAADSCDYTRNVLCNKKLSKTTTTTTTTQATAKTAATTKSPSRITASSRSTLFRTTTTTEPYEEEYEYEDDDGEEFSRNAEEDPKVIKELLDLIKKAGGIEELEKQLKIQEDGSAADTTTPSSISKSLVERVLGKAAKNRDNGRKNFYSSLNRNSRGPQNEGLHASEERDRERPQYTTITRQRSQKISSDEPDEEEDEEKDTTSKYNSKQPEYVTIRRGKTSTTTEETNSDSKVQFNRNKILGETDDKELDEDEEQASKKKTNTPQYVSIRRQRPSTTEETATSRYTVIQRGSTKADTDKNSEDDETEATTSTDTESSTIDKNDAKSKYKILRRGTTTEAPSSDNGSTLPSRKRGTTTSSNSDVTGNTKTRATTATSSTEKNRTIKRGSTSNGEITNTESSVSNPSSITTTYPSKDEETTSFGTEKPIILEQILITSPKSLTIKTTASLNSAPKLDTLLPDTSNNTGDGVFQTQTPHLLEPRPFSLSTNSPSSIKPVTETSTRITKVSDPNSKLRVRQKFSNAQIDAISTTTEKPSPFRTRAPSRFKQSTPHLDHQTTKATTRPSVRARKRYSTTTESYSDSDDELDLNRAYRPAQIADLSSLTAVDFAALKELNKFSGSSKHRRTRPSTSSEKPADDSKTSSRTLARKQLSGATFGNSRRVVPTKAAEDQINSSSDTTHNIRPFTRSPPILTTEETTRATFRNRKVIRRLRPTSASKLQSSNLENNQNQLVSKKRFVRPGTTPVTESENLVENASGSSLLTRRFVRPSTIHAINLLPTTTERKIVSLNNDDENETSDDVSAEEGENIRLSESNIRENSNVNNQNVVNSNEGKKLKVLKRIRNKNDDEKAVTEPNVIIRTRKIVRKLPATESSFLSSTSTTESIDTTSNRKRKVIRRLRPTSALPVTEENSTEKTLHIRGRPFLVQQSTANLLEKEVDKNGKFKSKYKTISRTTTSSSVEDDSSEEENPEGDNHSKTTKIPEVDFSTYRTIDRSKYSTLNRGTTSTEGYDRKDDSNTQSRTKYRIFRPTVFHDDDDDDDNSDEQESTESVDNNSNSKLDTSTDDFSKELGDDFVRLRILRPTNDTAETNLTDSIINENITNTNIENTGDNKTESVLKDNVQENDEEEEENLTTEENDDITTTTTVRNYVNPILTRQKNRPAFVRPKLTTESPTRTTSNTKAKYKTLGRSTTFRPQRINLNSEETSEVDKEKLERKFVPRGRTRYASTKVEATSEKTFQEVEEINSNSTESSYNVTTESSNVYEGTSEDSNTVVNDIETTTLIENKLLLEELTTLTPINTETTSTFIENSNITNEVKSSTTTDDITSEKTLTNNLEKTTESSTTTSTILLATILPSDSEDNNETMTESIKSENIVTTLLTSTDSSSLIEDNNSTLDQTEIKTTSVSTPAYTLKSTLRPSQNRPKYTVPRRLTTESTTRSSNRFNQRNRSQTVKSFSANVKSTTPYVLLKNRFPNKYSTTERHRFIPKDKTPKPVELDETENEEYDNEESEDEETHQFYTPRPLTTTSTRAYTSKSKQRASNRPEGFSFRKTTDTPKVTEELKDIDTEAVKNRNKNLFAKKRKMNTPFAGHSSEEKSISSTTPEISESVTKPTTVETTETLTTLHHVFAETEHTSDLNNATTENTTNLIPIVEKLIEVNRIVEVHDVNDSSIQQENKFVDKIGVINRVTVVKVVDGNPSPEENEITIENTTSKDDNLSVVPLEVATVREIPSIDFENGSESPERQDRKFEFYGNSKVIDYSNKNSKGAEIIDGISNINIITPRPHYSTEASTISLEALFQTDTPQKLNVVKQGNDEELLETDNSQYINVRVYDGKDGQVKSQAPVRDPKEEDYITMRAQVVEVTPKISKEFIKIVPIQVEMSRKLIVPSDFETKVENGVPKVNFQIIKPEKN